MMKNDKHEPIHTFFSTWVETSCTYTIVHKLHVGQFTISYYYYYSEYLFSPCVSSLTWPCERLRLESELDRAT